MKTFKNIDVTRAILSVVIVLCIAIALQSCAKKLTFGTSTIVPAAEGTVKVKKDKNNNYNIDLKIERLAEAKRLNPPKETYVVWMETEQNGTKNIGQLNTSSGLFSGKLKSSLKTVTPFKPVSIFITAEDDASIQYPGMQVVLRTNAL